MERTNLIDCDQSINILIAGIVYVAASATCQSSIKWLLFYFLSILSVCLLSLYSLYVNSTLP